MADTTIRVSEELADELYKRKGRSTSYEDYIWQLLEEEDGVDTDEAHDGGRGGGADPPIETPDPSPDVDRSALRDELAGSGDVLEARADAIVTMYEFLREHRSAEKSELLDAIDVDATGYASPASVWANCVKGRDTLRALPGVEPPSTGMSTWRYTNE